MAGYPCDHGDPCECANDPAGVGAPEAEPRMSPEPAAVDDSPFTGVDEAVRAMTMAIGADWPPVLRRTVSREILRSLLCGMFAAGEIELRVLRIMLDRYDRKDIV